MEAAETKAMADLKAKLDANNEKLSSAKTKLRDSEKSFAAMEKTYEVAKAEHGTIEQELQRLVAVWPSY